MSSDRPVRTAALMAALSAATDFAKGFPEEQAVRTCRIAMRLAEAAGLDGTTQRDVFYVSLLRFVGCTATAPDMAAALGDELAISEAFAAIDTRDLRTVVSAAAGLIKGRGPRRAVELGRFLRNAPGVVREHEVASCEVGRLFATRVGLPDGTAVALGQIFERFDGHGHPGKTKGDGIALAARVAQTAHVTEVLTRTIGPAATRDALLKRAGGMLDPELATLAAGNDYADAPADNDDAEDDVLAAEPTPWLMLSNDTLDTALAAIGAIADLKSAYTRGHAAGVAERAAAAGQAMGMPDAEITRLRRAGWVHDLGRMAVSAAVWDRPGKLSSADWEQVRLHPYVTERVLARCADVADLATLAGAHHERCDGSGYHRGLPGLGPSANLLAAADVYQALGEPRAHRPAYPDAERLRVLANECASGRLDRDAVDAVVAGAGGNRVAGPAQSLLTQRELEVLALVARGATNRVIAETLAISAKTVNAHMEHIFTKLEVTTRGAAVYAALQQRLLPA